MPSIWPLTNGVAQLGASIQSLFLLPTGQHYIFVSCPPLSVHPTYPALGPLGHDSRTGCFAQPPFLSDHSQRSCLSCSSLHLSPLPLPCAHVFTSDFTPNAPPPSPRPRISTLWLPEGMAKLWNRRWDIRLHTINRWRKSLMSRISPNGSTRAAVRVCWAGSKTYGISKATFLSSISGLTGD